MDSAGQVDRPALERLLKRQVEGGSSGVVIAGTTWFLDAFANTDANVECRAACLSMLQ